MLFLSHRCFQHMKDLVLPDRVRKILNFRQKCWIAILPPFILPIMFGTRVVTMRLHLHYLVKIIYLVCNFLCELVIDLFPKFNKVVFLLSNESSLVV